MIEYGQKKPFDYFGTNNYWDQILTINELGNIAIELDKSSSKIIDYHDNDREIEKTIGKPNQGSS
jgi:hypothetical protein